MCMPGTSPSRTASIPMLSASTGAAPANVHDFLRSRFSKIPSAKVTAVPLGASNLCIWWVSVIDTSYWSNPFIIFARYLLTAKKTFTPTLKLEVQKKALPFSSANFLIPSILSAQPVVPQTTGTPSSNAFRQFSSATFGIVNSMAASALRNASEWMSSILSTSMRATISCPRERAIFSIILPILPYPIRAIFIYVSC